MSRWTASTRCQLASYVSDEGQLFRPHSPTMTPPSAQQEAVPEHVAIRSSRDSRRDRPNWPFETTSTRPQCRALPVSARQRQPARFVEWHCGWSSGSLTQLLALAMFGRRVLIWVSLLPKVTRFKESNFTYNKGVSSSSVHKATSRVHRGDVWDVSCFSSFKSSITGASGSGGGGGAINEHVNVCLSSKWHLVLISTTYRVSLVRFGVDVSIDDESTWTPESLNSPLSSLTSSVASGVFTSVVCRFRLLKWTVGSGESAIRDMGEKIFS